MRLWATRGEPSGLRPAEALEARRLLAILAPGQFELFADEALATRGLTGSYFDQSLRAEAAPGDWRATHPVAGTRVDPSVSFSSRSWGSTRAALGLTGGTDADWDHFSAQWDGFIRVLTGHLNLNTRSDAGSRLYVDVNRDGGFDTSAGSVEVIDNNWGTDPAAAAEGRPSVALAPGVYSLRLQYETTTGDNVMQLRTAAAPMVRVAYVIPNNRQPQPNGVANLRSALPVMREWYREAFDRRGMEQRTFLVETEPDGVTPLVHVVRVNQTDAFLRGDIWGRVNSAATAAGVPLFAANQVWLLVPEIHTMASNGDVTGGVALGASNGSGSDGGAAMIGSPMLPSFRPGALSDDRPYNGTVVPELGPHPMVQDVSFPWFEGTTFSSVASSHYGAAVHELTHAFGMPHDFRNDSNFDGNLMGNGFRGFRGIIHPDRYPSDGTYLQSGQAEVLHNSRYFRHVAAAPENTGPSLTVTSGGVVNSALRLNVTASDPSGLRAAIVQRGGDGIGELVFSGATSVNTTFETTLYNPGESAEFAVMAYDAWGNRTRRTLTITPATTPPRGPQPDIATGRQTVRAVQQVLLDARGTTFPTAVNAEWDIDGDGTFDTPPDPDRTHFVTYATPGTRMVRARLTPAAGGPSVVSAPIPVRVLPATPQTGGASGRVFQDVNGDARRDPLDPPAPAVAVYADQNGNSRRDATEPFALSAADGTYTLSGLAAGVHTLRAEAPAGTVVSSPVSTGLPVVVWEGEVSAAHEFGARDAVAPRFLGASFSAEGGTHRLVFEFDEDVSTSFTPADLALLHVDSGLPGGANEMAIAFTPDGRRATVTFPLYRSGRLPAGAWWAGLIPAGVTDRAGNPLSGARPFEFTVYADVVGRHVFYNNGFFDGGDPSAGAADDGAIAADKAALLAGQSATFANVTSYSRGINGVMVDLASLQVVAALTAADFTFRYGAGADPATWTDAPPPESIAIRFGAGANGADRVTLVWPDGAIRRTWLRVIVKANANTGLASPDVFYFGNVEGETGDSSAGAALAVTTLDFLRTKRAMLSDATVNNRHDFNRDGRVSPVDLAIVRSAMSQRRTLPLLSAPPNAPPPTSQAVDDDDEVTALLLG